jgi:hypothetical protein
MVKVFLDQMMKVDQWPPDKVKAIWRVWSSEDDMQM